MRNAPRTLPTVALVLLLITSGFAMVANPTAAWAQPRGDGEQVTQTPADVRWHNMKSKNALWFVRNDNTGQSPVDEGAPRGVGGMTTDRPSQVTFIPEAYLVEENNAMPQTRAQFQTNNFTNGFTVKGANALAVRLFVEAQPSLKWTIRVDYIGPDGADREVAKLEDFIPDAPRDVREGYRANITISETIPWLQENLDRANTLKLEEGSSLRITIYAEKGPNYQPPAGGGTVDEVPGSIDRASWVLKREGRGEENASHMVLWAEDAIRAAGWITDYDRQVTDVLVNHTDNEKDVIDAKLVVQSAFGFDDLDDVEPYFHLKRNQSGDVTLQPGNLQRIEMREDDGLTFSQQGIRGWELPNEYWDYSHALPGEYHAFMGADTFRKGGSGPVGGLEVQWDFLLSNQDITLSMFADDTTTHTVLPNGSTTFLVKVNNTGGTRDTLDLSLSSSALVQGWRAEIKGPNLLPGDSIRLGTNESSLLRITVHAPSSASVGASELFTLNATSNLDPTVHQEIDLLATVDDERVNDVGIIGGAETVDVSVRPRDNGSTTIYAWNKGTVPSDLVVQMREGAPNDKWNVTLRSQGRVSDGFTLSSVPPGDVEAVDVHFRTLGGLGGGASQTAFVNATYAGASGDFEAPVAEITAEVELDQGVRLDILNSVSGKLARYMEMECDDTSSTTSCPDSTGTPSGPFNAGTNEDVDKDEDDGLDASYFRVWVTNTGDETQTFRLDTTTGRETPRLNPEPYRCTKTFLDQRTFEAGSNNDPQEQKCDQNAPSPQIPTPELLQITSDGTERTITEVKNLGPGQTAEVYVKVHHRKNAVYFAETDYTFNVIARADDGRSFATSEIKVLGRNGVEGQSALKIEPVARLPGYDDTSADQPLVNIDRAREDTVLERVGITAGDDERAFATYRVRVTNGATYAHFISPSEKHPAETTVSLDGIKSSEGWKAKLVPADKFVGNGTNWMDSHSFRNCRDTDQDGDCDEYVGYMDKEYVVRVWLPKVNDEQKPLAGESNSVVVKVEGNGDLKGADSVILETQILDMPRLNLETESLQQFVQPGTTTAFLVNLNNTGGARGTFQLQADTPTGWSVSPTFKNYTLAAYEERPVALLVTAPASASPGQEVDIHVKATWDDPRDTKKDDGKQERLSTFLNLTAAVVEKGDIALEPTSGETATIAPGSTTDFGLTVKNTAQNSDREVRLEAFSSGKWGAFLSKDSFEGTNSIGPGESRSVNLKVRAPTDAIEGSTHAFMVKAYAAGDESNFAVQTFTVTINDGEGRPVVKVDKVEKLVERGSYTRFAVDVQNRGTATDTFPLVLTEPSVNGWSARVEDRNGVPIQELELQPSTRERVFINVSAPFEEDEGTVVDTRLTVYNSNYENQAQASLTATLQDYSVGLTMPRERVDYIPGMEQQIPVYLTNRGNGNDTLNVSMDLQGLEGAWSVTFNQDTFRLEPGETEEAIATLRSPKSPLPTPRTLTFRVWAGTQGGADVNEWDNRTQNLVVNVLPYRSQDVDDDGFLELAVDRNKDRRDGYEEYREIFNQGRNSTFLQRLDGDMDGEQDLLLDDPGDSGLDGVADMYWDPDDVVVYRIRWTPDVDQDGSPDYLLDTDGDDVVDAFWNPRLQILGDAEARRIVGDSEQRQFLLDTDGDGRLDTYYDPVKDLTTKILDAAGQGEHALGIDTTGNGRADKYYNTRSEEVSDAQVANLSSFAQQYWYLFALLALVVVVFGVVLYRRRQDEEELAEEE